MSIARLLSLIAFACLTLLPARADDAAARKAVEDAFQKNLAALKSQDIAALKTLRTQDWVLVNPDGKREGLAAFIKEMKEQFKQGARVISGSLAIEKVTPTAKEIEATARITFNIAVPSPDGKKHDLEQSAHTRVTFVRAPGGLKLKKSLLLAEPIMKLDGQPFPPKPET